MKLRLEKIDAKQEEGVLIRYREMTPTLQTICTLVEKGHQKILGMSEQGNVFLQVDDILYFESVDGKTFAYTDHMVYQIPQTLKDLSATYGSNGFFRCAKGMLVNIYRISAFKSQSFGRIEATLENGEVVIISRKFAGELRQVLQEGVQDEN
ncbi:LytTR family DNA-binding domain-containing protein [Streptococcus merionis]|uniref:Response regulator of the LytR/AlgR family n=1 Tax=Streptococcus merionis TaxID=400065 RepID=A0A239T0Z8_9STRE|nr:LytTR family DNA-binding domain-containing protein [Streptococcus merionis]SNU91152.1 Response regulator of the LytR/AlgR family [Streptococcus merionis]